MIFQLLFSVLFPKEHGVSQSRPDHALIAFCNDFRLGAVDIGNGDEVVHQTALFIEQGEVLLILLHGEDQGFRWNFQETLLETAGNGYGPFVQSRDFIQQGGVDIRLAPQGLGHFLHLGSDVVAPGFEVSDYFPY